MNCPKCGHKNKIGSKVCGNCGMLLEDKTPIVDKETKSNHLEIGEYFEISSLQLRPGQKLGTRYVVINSIGEGGFGQVYTIEDKIKNEVVVFKFLRPELALDTTTIKRFKGEIHISRKISHPNIVNVYGFAKCGSTYYIAMEYIEGADLRKVLRKAKKLKVEQTISVIGQVCMALDVAHRNTIIHRDIKPENVLIHRSGAVKVADFGLAKATGMGTGESKSMTATSALIGTPEYMSPEQVRGITPDQRSDIYALGVMMYELLIGKVPFKDEAPMMTLLKHLNEPPVPLRKIDKNLPEWIENIVMKMLEKDPKDRFQSVREIIKALQRRDKYEEETTASAEQTFTKETMASKAERILGIDLGTTNSCVAIMEAGRIIICPDKDAHNTTPSVIAFTQHKEILIGYIAKNQMITNPENTIYSVKRFMGRRANEIYPDANLVSYKVVGSGDELCKIKIGKRELYPPEISAIILKKMKSIVEEYIGKKFTKAVITVPAYFDDGQRQATKDAGRIAGLEVMRIINEPTAAALAYGLNKIGEDENQIIAVYDLGGGTFDISILEQNNDVFEVRSTNGDTHLGGDDFDRCILEWMIKEFERTSNVSFPEDRLAIERLKNEAEKTKITLSSVLNAHIRIPFLTSIKGEAKHLNLTLTRETFEQLINNLIQKTIKSCQDALTDADLTYRDIDVILLVGGSTRIPMVQKAVKEFFNKEPSTELNPDEAVAYGAAIQGAIISQSIDDMLLLDITPLSLGVEVQGNLMRILIGRNSTIPTKKSMVFTTQRDNQEIVRVRVLQGERAMADDNRTLAQFYLTGIPPASRNIPRIEVTFDIDANGIVHVSAKDLATGNERQIEVKTASGLSEAEVQRMIKNAQEYSQVDFEKQQLSEAHSRLDKFINMAEHFLEEEFPTKEEREKIETTLENAKQLLEISEATIE